MTQRRWSGSITEIHQRIGMGNIAFWKDTGIDAVLPVLAGRAGAAGDLAASIFVPAHKAGCAINIVIAAVLALGWKHIRKKG